MKLRVSRLGQRAAMAVLLLMVGASGGCKDRQWKLWNAYAARFVDAQGRVFDPRASQTTTSEGEAYAMFFSLVANDRGSAVMRALVLLIVGLYGSALGRAWEVMGISRRP